MTQFLTRAQLIAWSVVFGTLFCTCANAAESSRQLSPQELEFLRNVDSITVYGIHPHQDKSATKFIGGYPIAATAEVKSAEGRSIVVESLKQAIESGVSEQACFTPHHAIKATGKDGIIHIFIICFECCQAKELITTPSGDSYRSYVVWPFYQSALNAIIGAANPSYLKDTMFFSVMPVTEIKVGEEITIHNSTQFQKWKDESSEEDEQFDYERHPRATRDLRRNETLYRRDFKYAE